MKFENVEVTHVTDWFPITKIPTEKNPLFHEMIQKYGRYGIYQVALKKDIESIGTEFIHEKIVYTGVSAKGKDGLLGRTYSIRTPAGAHGVSRYIRQNEIDRSTVFIRYAYTPNDTMATSRNDLPAEALERSIHSITKEKFGFTFAWTEASLGTNGKVAGILDDGKKLTSEELLYIISEYRKYAIEANAKEFLAKLEEI